GLMSALMEADRAVLRQPNGAPDLTFKHAFHIENKTFVAWLERTAQAHGVMFVNGQVEGVKRLPQGGIRALRLDGDREVAADFFVDASGFRSELIGQVLEEPFISYSDSLFNDRAVVGGWP